VLVSSRVAHVREHVGLVRASLPTGTTRLLPIPAVSANSDSRPATPPLWLTNATAPGVCGWLSGGERGVDALRNVSETYGVGADQANAVPVRRSGQHPLQSLPLLAGLAKAGADDHDVTKPGGAALLQRLDGLRCGQAQEREVRRVRNVRDGGVRLEPLNLIVLAVHRIHVASEAARQERPAAAGFAGAVARARADQRDAPRGEEGGKVWSHHACHPHVVVAGGRSMPARPALAWRSRHLLNLDNYVYYCSWGSATRTAADDPERSWTKGHHACST
jgi:hypothetical protein